MRIDAKLRAAINADLDVAGFGGGRRFQRIGQALTAVCDVLEKHGLEPAVVFSAHTFDRPKGHRLIDLAFSNPADSFSPTAVENCGLSYTWENIGVGGNDSYEVIAYIS